MKINDGRHPHLIPKLSVSGAAETSHCGAGAMELGRELGRQIGAQGGIIVTGATTGFPLWAAMGAKESGAFSIGFSPAASEHEHKEAYRLPVDYMDLIVYTGFGYSGRDLIMTRSSDAVFFGCGRVGTIHEFTVAFEDKKPIGILEGAWDTDETIKTIIERSNREHGQIVISADPEELVAKVLVHVEENKSHTEMTYSYRVPE